MKICSKNVSPCVIVVVVSQILAWTAVSALLFYRGLNDVWTAKSRHYDDDGMLESSSLITAGNDTTVSVTTYKSVALKGYASGVFVLVVACVMVAVGPIMLIIVIIEKCYRRNAFVRYHREDQPPRYEEIMEEMLPRYSTLFINSGNQNRR